MGRSTYYTDINQNPYLELRWFLSFIKRVEKGESFSTKAPFRLKGMDYFLDISISIYKDSRDNIIRLFLLWEDEGEVCKQTIAVKRERSNLKPNYFVYYFLCPLGNKCRKLYYIGNRFISRRNFEHKYYCQRISHEQRNRHYYTSEEPYRPYGKRYYRNRLTPYGKKCKKFEKYFELGAKSFVYVLNNIVKRNKKKSNVSRDKKQK